jgi:tetratricopeptide (TPR) repeat protein
MGQGMPEEAMTEFENEAKISGDEDAFLKTNMGQIYAMIGRIDEARQILNELLERAQSENIPKTLISQLYFTLGEEDKGFEFLDKAYEEHDEYLIFVKISPGFDTVRSDPRFIALLKKMNLEP